MEQFLRDFFTGFDLKIKKPETFTMILIIVTVILTIVIMMLTIITMILLIITLILLTTFDFQFFLT